MESLTGGPTNGLAVHLQASNNVSCIETPVVGKPRHKRVATTTKSADGTQVISIVIEEYDREKLIERHIELYAPTRQTTREKFDSDSNLIVSDTERYESNGLTTKILIKGSGKSSTTRITYGECEARATERLIMIETPKASYSFQPFEGKWSSFYKDIDMRLDLKANFLKGPDSILAGPDGISLIFQKARLVDVLFLDLLTASSSDQSRPTIID